jgi:hypothetical protein
MMGAYLSGLSARCGRRRDAFPGMMKEGFMRTRTWPGHSAWRGSGQRSGIGPVRAGTKAPASGDNMCDVRNTMAGVGGPEGSRTMGQWWLVPTAGEK